MTYPLGPAEDEDVGFRSLVTIRNEWSGWDIDSVIDYETHPEKAVRITCAHEFFHAIQYRMSHEVVDDRYLDDFPLSWIEGTAVMMEELCFPDVNDYTQYSGDYFSNPSRFTVLSGTTGNAIYSNVLICLYLYVTAPDETDGIDFFKTVFLANMTAPVPFNEALISAAENRDCSWVDLLSAFHTASFYTGGRSTGTSGFLPDARMLPEWSYVQGNANGIAVISRTVKPRSCQILSFTNNDGADSTLRISAATNSTDSGACAIRAILRSSDDAVADSTALFEKTASDTFTLKLDSWNRWEEAVVVVTSGLPDIDLSVRLFVTVNGDSSNQVVAAPSSPVLHFGNARGKRFLLNGRVAGKAAVLSASGKSAAMKAQAAGIYVRENGGRGLREALVR